MGCFLILIILLFGKFLVIDSFDNVGTFTRCKSSKFTLNVVKKKISKKISNLPDLSQREFPTPPDDPYSLVVIGCGPGGEAIATTAAKLGVSVAIIERKSSFGGPTGLTSKAVREAAKRISKAVDQVIGGDRRRQIRKLFKRRFPVLRTEAEVLQAAESRSKLKDAGIDLFVGEATMIHDENGKSKHDIKDEVTVRVCRPSGCVELQTKNCVIATGSRPNVPKYIPGTVVRIPFEDDRVMDATKISSMSELPVSIFIVGGGVIAVEYATVFAELGVGVTLCCPKERLLSFLDEDLKDELVRSMIANHVLIVEENVHDINPLPTPGKVSVGLEPRVGKDGKSRQRRFLVDCLLYSGGRDANSEGLGCDDVGVELLKYGRIKVDGTCRSTSQFPIYAIGDVIGPPGLASTAMQQGRDLARKLFEKKASSSSSSSSSSLVEKYDQENIDVDDIVVEDIWVGYESDSSSSGSNMDAEATLFGTADGIDASIDTPLTLWTIPEIASVGSGLALGVSETRNGEVGSIVRGIAYFKDSARGRLSGDPSGFIKVAARITEQGTHQIIGVGIFGEGANELIQIGSIFVHSATTLEVVSRTPFAAVTMTSMYQTACDDALSKSPLHKSKATYSEMKKYLAEM